MHQTWKYRNHVSNGFFACGDCLARGIWLSHAVRYPCNSRVALTEFEPRTHKGYLEDSVASLSLNYLDKMQKSNKIFHNKEELDSMYEEMAHGVYGKSVFEQMAVCDLSQLFPAQNMHLLWENMIPHTFKLLFSPKYAQEKFSSNKNLDKVDRRIASIVVPLGEKSFRPLSDLFEDNLGLKGHEIRNFALFH